MRKRSNGYYYYMDKYVIKIGLQLTVSQALKNICEM